MIVIPEDINYKNIDYFNMNLIDEIKEYKK